MIINERLRKKKANKSKQKPIDIRRVLGEGFDEINLPISVVLKDSGAENSLLSDSAGDSVAPTESLLDTLEMASPI